MAIRTMSMSSGGNQYNEGWHTLTIKQAEYGSWKSPTGDSKKFIDVWFNDYPENFNLRVYAVHNKETNEEFKIANLFRNANAGIMSVLQDPTGKKPVIQYDDDASGLAGKTINAYFYKEEGKDGNQYARIFDDIAPIEQETDQLSWTIEQVSSLKSGVEKRVAMKKNAKSGSVGFGATTNSNNDPFAGIPS